MKDHYQKAADEIIKAVKRLKCNSYPQWIGQQPNFRKAKRLIIQMLKTNFVAKKSKFN